ncbi:hypothetical protein VO56_02280 [Mycoplasmopsis gallinacea]|uniref:Uncharacterized protein n=1 Tax=Mycoplasmopsis gallinacea TaxID=29556 RepID=A0A0D5ZJW0_9BACT|nr:hypothetical protein VO56_02280 [Mycoplasmopsis gallinacea]
MKVSYEYLAKLGKKISAYKILILLIKKFVNENTENFSTTEIRQEMTLSKSSFYKGLEDLIEIGFVSFSKGIIKLQKINSQKGEYIKFTKNTRFQMLENIKPRELIFLNKTQFITKKFKKNIKTEVKLSHNAQVCWKLKRNYCDNECEEQRQIKHFKSFFTYNIYKNTYLTKKMIYKMLKEIERISNSTMKREFYRINKNNKIFTYQVINYSLSQTL